MIRPESLTRYAWLSIFVALLTMGIKAAAYQVTGSVGLLSDAMESIVNLSAAVVAVATLRFSAQPADEHHHFGHGKADYFASGFEGVLIIAAAAAILFAAWDRYLHPRALASLDLGLGLAVAAAAINGLAGWLLVSVGRKAGSIVLEADGKHLLTDVWTSVGTVCGVAAAGFTGWHDFDPGVAALVGLNIIWTGGGLVRRSIAGLLDASLPSDENTRIREVLDAFRERGIGFHDLRTRQSGAHRFMSVHVLVPGAWTVQSAHDMAEEIEAALCAALANLTVVTHIEPIEDPASFAHHEPFPAIATEIATPRSRPPSGSPRRHAKRLRIAAATGTALLVGGSASSMMTSGGWIDASLGAALLGFLLILAARRHGEARRRKEGVNIRRHRP
ncbi:cation diffusion facilitator family transporter [Methylococcus geothermalis]|uniref:Cation diffusion facilitator family transporter n=1 Tax=Methylococcus geothermalis TaxID=2681310 RepID=A0A858Q8N0_9GAMM|nr:cation diffusion facilitator family transporter [Methylococcus geothermalis]QJD30209.1 cation diffusion facilitator family transporter [Methylococcus geothermalis]